MPLWKIYHSSNAFSSEEKHKLAGEITKIYSVLPSFYVGVVFQEIPKESFFIGGEPVDNFVRIWVDHIARTLPTPETKERFVRKCDDVLAPFIRDKEYDWEFHIDETPFELWSIQGMRPPPPNSEHEKKWKQENKPTPYASSPAKAG
jgi:phenylpyruvate tautomerase PptA (4-oxalocrotonate tautomerase family)